MAEAASATMTSAPARAAARATASPTTPAPTTKTCIARALHRIRSAMDGGVRAFSGQGESGRHQSKQQTMRAGAFSSPGQCEPAFMVEIELELIESRAEPTRSSCVTAPGRMGLYFGSYLNA